MKRIISSIFLIFIVFLISLFIILSTIGIETDKFNNLITQKIKQSNNFINLNLKSINYKFDFKEIKLFLETKEPEVYYRKVLIPAKDLKVYIDFSSLLKSKPIIEKINLSFDQINIDELKELSSTFKPSNLTSFINNKLNKGKFNSEIEIFLKGNNLFDNFIAKGKVTGLEAQIIDNLYLKNTNFSFFADKSDILIKKIFGETGPFTISDGNLKIGLNSEITLNSNFDTTIKYNKITHNLENLETKLKFLSKISKLEAKVKNEFNLNFDKTYKVTNYLFKSNGKILNSKLEFKNQIKNNLLNYKIDQLHFKDVNFKTNIEAKKSSAHLEGEYSTDDENFLKFDLNNAYKNEIYSAIFKFDYDKDLNFNLINYKKPKNKVANLIIDFNKKKNQIKINSAKYQEGKNSVLVQGLSFNKGKLESIGKVDVKTSSTNKVNNDFSIIFGKKIFIKGDKFDASNLISNFNQSTKNKQTLKISKDIKISLTNIIAPKSENLKDFMLIGKIKNGKFTNISAKGDFGNNNFLDINMKSDEKLQKKYFEIYSDITKPLLTEFNFFKGLTGGKLLYSSIIDNDGSSVSKLTIENFKVVNAPGMVKLLSLADLGGLADLAKGDGISFDILEISMEKEKDILKLNEILALGPSISVLVEGYQDPKVTSLRGTLVPAKNLNKLISKIPVIGDIVIPKEVGEGLFGISFKIKGPPGRVKTTINPIRTITPRFIQKIVDKNKKTK